MFYRLYFILLCLFLFYSFILFYVSPCFLYFALSPVLYSSPFHPTTSPCTLLQIFRPYSHQTISSTYFSLIFYLILMYSAQLYSILFHSNQLHSTLLHSIYSTVLYSILLYFTLFYFIFVFRWRMRPPVFLFLNMLCVL